MYNYLFPLYLLFFLNVNTLRAETEIDYINKESFTNYQTSYNYTYWKDSWKTKINERSFINHSSEYAFAIDFNKLAIKSLMINEQVISRQKAFRLLDHEVITKNNTGDIHYAIIKDGAILHEKNNKPTYFGGQDSQLATYGTWFNQRFVSTNFTNNPKMVKNFTGIEFASWHDRLKLTFHVMPSENIKNGQLQLSLQMPAEYAKLLNTQNIYAFSSANADNGFVLKAGKNTASANVKDNKFTVISNAQDFQANKSYELSILIYAVTKDLKAKHETIFNQESQINVKAVQIAPKEQNLEKAISYDEDHAIHYIKMPRVGMGQGNCDLIDEMQKIDLELSNTSTEKKKVRLCFSQAPNSNVTGFNSIICHKDGTPSGFPLQVSKNWHTTQKQLFSGSWIKEYTELIIPANTSLHLQYRRTGAKWGQVYTASSHQLCVVGAGVPRGGWLEASLGGFGENITHSPDYEYGSTIGADIRPFLVTGKSSRQCNWTGNVGGLDLFVYKDDKGKRCYQSQVKTDLRKQSPNLTETTISSISSDKKLKFEYSFFLSRSDDFTKVYYKLKMEALQDATFSRFDLFQLGGDVYNIHNAQKIVYGNESGVTGKFDPINSGSNDYTRDAFLLKGKTPWLWAGDGLYYAGAKEGKEIDTNNGMIIRKYVATLGGKTYTSPYVRERSSAGGFSKTKKTNPTSYCVVTPPSIKSFKKGDKIEAIIELVVFPKQAESYYGPNLYFMNALAKFGNSYELLKRESNGNTLIAESPKNNINSDFPLTVETKKNEAFVEISNGKGYIPIVFSGLTTVKAPILWKAEKGGEWKQVDQSKHGKDFWQTEYNITTGLFDVIYNVNQDYKGDRKNTYYYYLGKEPSKKYNKYLK